MSRAGALAAVDAIVAAGGEADDALRAVVAALHEEYPWVAVRFNEEGTLVVGPTAGAEGGERLEQPITYNGERIGVLEVDAATPTDEDRALLAQVAERIAVFTLLGWDTGGEAWEP